MDVNGINIGETEIEFDPEINEINFRRLELKKLVEFLENDKSITDQERAILTENAEKESEFILAELKHICKPADEPQDQPQ